jgi:hypothetical protein
LLKRQLDRVRNGLDPINTFRDPAQNASIPLPTERIKHGITTRPS